MATYRVVVTVTEVHRGEVEVEAWSQEWAKSVAKSNNLIPDSSECIKETVSYGPAYEVQYFKDKEAKKDDKVQ